jgi:hypothetical protein
MSPNYQNGKIYSIRTPHTEKYYIGSTVKLLCKRLTQHKSDAKLNKNITKCHSLIHLGFDDVYIELIENYPCNSKEELNRREGELIRQFKDQLVNYRIEGRTREEYAEDNKDYIKQYRSEKFTCNCGGKFVYTHKIKHTKTKKHQKFMLQHQELNQ